MANKRATAPGMPADDQAFANVDPAVPAAIDRAVPAAIDDAVPNALGDPMPEAMPAVAEGAVTAAVPAALDEPVVNLTREVPALAEPMEQLSPMVQELPAGRAS